MSRAKPTKPAPVYEVRPGTVRRLYECALAAIDRLVDDNPPARSNAARALGKLAQGVAAYEKEKYPITDDEVRAAKARQKKHGA